MFQKALLLLSALLVAAPVFGLDYTESSGGLGTINWESGRSEIEFCDLNLDGNIDMVSIGDHGSPFINSDEHGIMFFAGNGEGRWSITMVGNFGYGGIAEKFHPGFAGNRPGAKNGDGRISCAGDWCVRVSAEGMR